MKTSVYDSCLLTQINSILLLYMYFLSDQVMLCVLYIVTDQNSSDYFTPLVFSFSESIRICPLSFYWWICDGYRTWADIFKGTINYMYNLRKGAYACLFIFSSSEKLHFWKFNGIISTYWFFDEWDLKKSHVYISS